MYDEFIRQDLTGARFDDVYLTRARFHDIDLRDARFSLVDLSGTVIRGAALVNVEISGEIENLRINGVDVAPLVETELNRWRAAAYGCSRPAHGVRWVATGHSDPCPGRALTQRTCWRFPSRAEETADARVP